MTSPFTVKGWLTIVGGVLWGVIMALSMVVISTPELDTIYRILHLPALMLTELCYARDLITHGDIGYYISFFMKMVIVQWGLIGLLIALWRYRTS